MWQLLPFSRGNVTITVSIIMVKFCEAQSYGSYTEHQPVCQAQNIRKLLQRGMGFDGANRWCSIVQTDLQHFSAQVCHPIRMMCPV